MTDPDDTPSWAPKVIQVAVTQYDEQPIIFCLRDDGSLVVGKYVFDMRKHRLEWEELGRP